MLIEYLSILCLMVKILLQRCIYVIFKKKMLLNHLLLFFETPFSELYIQL